MGSTIREVMVSPVVTATRHHTVADACRLMHHHGIGALPIVDPDGVPVGLVTVWDLVRPDALPDCAVEAVMSRRVATISEAEDARRAARIMSRHGLHHLLVTRHGVLIGIVSAFDLLALVDAPGGGARVPA